jgi:murein DD-endopeptidase MepM/ murein hydrolase activator NlpD
MTEQASDEKNNTNSIPDEESSIDSESKPAAVNKIKPALQAFFSNLTVLRVGLYAVAFIVVVLVVWGIGMLIVNDTSASPEFTLTPSSTAVAYPESLATPIFSADEGSGGLVRQPEINTTVSSEVITRYETFTYTVQQGDNIFDIAEKFDLEPETVLWTNRYTLGDTPDGLSIGQEILIYPMDGAVHQWYEGDGLNGVAKYYGVTPEDIINYPANNLNPETIGDYSNPNIEPGTMVFIPGGIRQVTSWITAREDPVTGRISYLGAGSCDVSIYSQSGTGTFTWPTTATWLSGYDYTPPTHNGLDFDGDFGSPIYASDSGVIVYSGWSDRGYGNIIVVDHDRGWQTFYAHLMDGTMLPCGVNVQKGELIASMGSTGNSTGPHLHFEMRLNGQPVNPWQFLQ